MPNLSAVRALQTNLGFEAGNLRGWESQGNVEVLKETNFLPGIQPPEGEYFALLSSGPGISPAPDGVDIDGNGYSDYDITTLSLTFYSNNGTLSFYWCWLTNEEEPNPLYDDFFIVRLDGEMILNGSVNKDWYLDLSPFPDVPTDTTAYKVLSSGPTNGSIFGDGRSDFQVCTVTVSKGLHTIEFLIADAYDQQGDSGLLIDSLKYPHADAVGGYLVPANGLELLAPLAVFCSLASLTLLVGMLFRKKPI